MIKRHKEKERERAREYIRFRLMIKTVWKWLGCIHAHKALNVPAVTKRRYTITNEKITKK